MAVNGVYGNTTNSVTNGATITSGQQTIDMQTFLRLITVQMTSQDPLNPVSDSEFASQLAQLGTVQGMDNLQRSGQVQEAAALLGRTVVATNPSISATNSSPTITGTVVGMVNQNGSFQLSLKDSTGALTNVSTSSIQSVSY